MKPRFRKRRDRRTARAWLIGEKNERGYHDLCTLYVEEFEIKSLLGGKEGMLEGLLFRRRKPRADRVRWIRAGVWG